MSYKFKPMEKAVGVFIVVAVLAFLSLIILIMRGKSFFVPKNSYYTYFSSGENITKGMDINYNGMKIGQINDIKLSSDNRIYIGFYVRREYSDRIKHDSVANFVPGLLGGGKMNITPGTVGTIPLANGAYINSSDSERGKEILKLHRSSTAEGLNGLINNANELLKQLHDPQGNLNVSLERIQTVLDTLNMALANVNRISGSVGKDDLDVIMLNLRKTTDNLVEVTKNLKHNRIIGGSPEKKDKNSLPATK